MSSPKMQLGFIEGIMAEIATLSSDLPSGGPANQLLPGHEQIGTITDPRTKALHFMLERGTQVLNGIDADLLDLQARQKRESLPFEDEEKAIAQRRVLQELRMTAVKALFWASVEAVVADTLATGKGRAVSIAGDWAIGYQKQATDPFADSLLGSLLMGGLGRPRFGVISGSELAELLR